MFLTLRPAHLGLGDSYEAAGNLYSADAMNTIRRAIADTFRGLAWFAVEVGQGKPGQRGRLHVHVIAADFDLPPGIQPDTERCKRVYNAEGLFRYLHKPPESWSLEAELDYRAARTLSPNRALPQTRGFVRSAGRAAWVAEQIAAKRPICTMREMKNPFPSKPRRNRNQASVARLHRSHDRLTAGKEHARAWAANLRGPVSRFLYSFTGPLRRKMPEKCAANGLFMTLQAAKRRNPALRKRRQASTTDTPGTPFSTAHPANAPNAKGWAGSIWY